MPSPALILVRHGRPAIDPDKPSTTWPLCPDGREAVQALAGRIAAYSPVAVLSSPEPKARETAEIIAERLGLGVEIDARLHEHKRPNFAFGSEEAFRQRIAEVFADPAKPTGGVESVDQACARLAAALEAHAARPLVAVTHGTVLSHYVAKRLDLDPLNLWRSLHLPDGFVLDAGGGLIARLG